MNEVEKLARSLRQTYHGRRLLRPMWRDMDDIERDGWLRLAKRFKRYCAGRPPEEPRRRRLDK